MPFTDTGAEPLQQPEMLVLREQFRLQGLPLVRWVPRQTQGGGFGRPEDHPRSMATHHQRARFAARVDKSRPSRSMVARSRVWRV